MRIPGELLSSPWIYRASMAVLWSWLLTVILSLVLTAIAKRIAFVISQRENKGALKTASVSLVRVSIFVDWLTSFGKKPIVLLSFDSVQLHFRVPVGEEEGKGTHRSCNDKAALDACRSSFLAWLLEMTMPGNQLWPILHGIILVLRTISPLFKTFGVTFSRFKVKMTAEDAIDSGKELMFMEVYVNRASLRLVPDKSISHGLSLIVKVHSSTSSPCCASSNGLLLVTVDDNALKLDMGTTSEPLTFFLQWSLSVDAHESSSDKNSGVAVPRTQSDSSYVVVPERTAHVLLPKYTSLKIPTLTLAANEEALLQLIGRIQSCSWLKCHDVLSSTTSEISELTYSHSSPIESELPSHITEVPEHPSSSPFLFGAAADAPSIQSRQSKNDNILNIVSKLTPWMKMEIQLEALKAKLVTNCGAATSEVVLDSLLFHADGAHHNKQSCKFGCSCTSMSIRTTGGRSMTAHENNGEERTMFVSQVFKCNGFIDFVSSSQVHVQITGHLSSPCIVITDKDVDVALGFSPMYNALCGLHMALRDSGRMVKTINNRRFSDVPATRPLEVAIALTVSDIEVKALTRRRSGAPRLGKAEGAGGGTAAEGCYGDDFDPAVLWFHVPESKLHWSRDCIRDQPVSITLGIVEGNFQLCHRPAVPWLHLASLEMIIRPDHHIQDTASIVVFPNVTINALSLQLDWTPPAVFVFASLLSSVLKSCVSAGISSIAVNPAFGPLNHPRSGNATTGNHSQQQSTTSSSWSFPSLRDAEQMAACFSCNFSSMGSEHPPSGAPLVIANVFDVSVYVPRAPLSYKAGDLTEDSTLRWLDASLSESEWKKGEDWACECITVEHARIGVPTHPTAPVHADESSSHPTIMAIEINASFAEITVGRADCSTTGGGSVPFMKGWCGTQFATKPSPYLYVDKFAVRKWRASSNVPACVDVMSTGIRGTCTPHILERSIATSQGVTLAVWLTMLQVKRSRAQSMADIEALDKNLPWDSEIALQYWSKHWQSVIAEGYDAPSGDTLIRLNFCDVDITANFPTQCTELGETLDAITANVRAATFGSDSAPEHFIFDDITLSLREGECERQQQHPPIHHHELLKLSRLSVNATLQSFVRSDSSVVSSIKSPSNTRMLIGNAFYEIRARANACVGADTLANLPGNLSSLVFEPMGFLIEAWGIKISLEKDYFIAKTVEDTLSHAANALSSIKASGGRWHPAADGPSSDFHRLFWKPPSPRAHYDSSNGLSSRVIVWGESVWLRLHQVRFTIGDDRMEGWLDTLVPVWLSHLENREMVEKLREWPLAGGTVPLLMERRAGQDYIREARKALTTRQGQNHFVKVDLPNLSTDISPPLHGMQMCGSMLRRIGRNFSSTCSCTCLLKMSMQLELKGIRIRIRRADEPLISLPHLEVIGDVLLASKAAVASSLQKCTRATPSTTCLTKGRVLLDLKCSVGDASFKYCPAALASIEELALTMHTLCPPCIVELFGQDWAWWDMCRALIDGRVEILARNTFIYLSSSHRTASASCRRTATRCLSCGSCKRPTLQSAQKEETILVKVSMACAIIPSECSHVTLEAAGLSLELLGLHDLYPEMVVKPPRLTYTPPFLVAPIIQAYLGLDWVVNDPKYQPLHSSGVVFHLSAEILGIKDYHSEGLLTPFLYEVGKDVSPLAQSLPSQLEVNIFGINLVSFSRWLHCFVLERSPPLPPKCVVENGGPGTLSFSRHIQGFHLKHLEVSKADIALLHTDPGDPFRRGVRLTLQSGFMLAVVLAMEKVREKNGCVVMPDPFETGRLAIASPSKHVWTFSGLEVHVEGEGIEIRLVSHEAGPHGAFFVSAEGLHVVQSGGSMEGGVPTVSHASAFDIGYKVSDRQQFVLSKHSSSKYHIPQGRSWGSQTLGGIIPDMWLFTSMLSSASEQNGGSLRKSFMNKQMLTKDNVRLPSTTTNKEEGGAVVINERGHGNNTSLKFGQEHITAADMNISSGKVDHHSWETNDESSTSSHGSTSLTSDAVPMSDMQSCDYKLGDDEKETDEFDNNSRVHSKACQAHFSRLLSEKRTSITKLIRESAENNNNRYGVAAKPESNREIIAAYSTHSTVSTATPSDGPLTMMTPPHTKSRRLTSGPIDAEDHHAMGSEFLFEVMVGQPRVLLSPFILDSLAILAQDILELVLSAVPMAAAPPAKLHKRCPQGRNEGHLSNLTLWGINIPMNREEGGQKTEEEVIQRKGSRSIDMADSTTDSVPGIMHKLFSIETVALQVQLRDEEKSKSCAVLGIRSAIIQGWVGLDSGSGASTEEDDSNTPVILQYLAQRLLGTFQEAATLTMKGVMLFVAPTDIDVAAGVVWLPCDVFSLSGHESPCKPEKDVDDSFHAPDGIKDFILSGVLGEQSDSAVPFNGLGIFRPMVRDVPLITLQVLAQHGYPENHIIHLSVPPVLFEMDGKHQVWLFGLVSSVFYRGLPPELWKQWSQNTKKRQDVVYKKKQMTKLKQKVSSTGFSSLAYIPSVADVSETGGVDVAQACLYLRRLRWDLRLLLRLKEEVEKIWMCTRGGVGPPKVVVVALESWAAHADRLIKRLEVATAEGVIWLRHCVKETTKRIAQKPFTQIIAELKGLEIKLLQEESSKEAFFVVGIESIVVNMSVYDDESGCLDIGVKCCTAQWLESRKPIGYVKGGEEAAAAYNSQPASQQSPEGGLFVSENGAFYNSTDPLNTSGRFSTPRCMTVLAPVTTNDLPKLSSGALRSWTKKDDVIHLQAILASPSIDRVPVFWHVEISVFPLLVRLHGSLFEKFERYGDVCAAALHSPCLPSSRKAKDEFLMPRASMNRAKSKHGMKRERASAVATRASAHSNLARPSHTNIAEDGGYGSDDGQSLQLRSPMYNADLSEIGPNSGGTGLASVVADVPGVPFFKRHFILQHGRLGELNIFVSYTGGKSSSVAPESALEELDNFHLKLHTKTYINKTWTLQRAQSRIKRDAILDILKQVHRNFDNFGRFLAHKMGVKMRPSSKAAMNAAAYNKVENDAAATANTYLARSSSHNEMVLDWSQHNVGSSTHPELSDLPSKHLVRDSKTNRSCFSSYSGEQIQLRLEDIPEYKYGFLYNVNENLATSSADNSSHSVVLPPLQVAMVSTADDEDQWSSKIREGTTMGSAEAIEASTFLRPEKKPKGLAGKIGRSLNLKRRFSTQPNS